MDTVSPTQNAARSAPPAPRLSADTLAAARAVNAHYALRTAAWQASAFATEPGADADDPSADEPAPPAAP